MNPEDLASQSVRLKEEQLRREEEKLREIEVKVQREINEKRQELLARESQLKEIEARMHREQSSQLPDTDADDTSSETSSSNPSSGAWNNKRSSAMTDVTEFDDLYDISDEEPQRKEMLQANGIGRNMSSRRIYIHRL